MPAGAEEGTLAFRAATSELASGHCLVIDLGGRSTELAAGEAHVLLVKHMEVQTRHEFCDLQPYACNEA